MQTVFQTIIRSAQGVRGNTENRGLMGLTDSTYNTGIVEASSPTFPTELSVLETTHNRLSEEHIQRIECCLNEVLPVGPLVSIVVSYLNGESISILAGDPQKPDFWYSLIKNTLCHNICTRRTGQVLLFQEGKPRESHVPAVLWEFKCINDPYIHEYQHLHMLIQPLRDVVQFLAQSELMDPWSLFHGIDLVNIHPDTIPTQPESIEIHGTKDEGFHSLLVPWLVDWCRRMKLQMAVPLGDCGYPTKLPTRNLFLSPGLFKPVYTK